MQRQHILFWIGWLAGSCSFSAAAPSPAVCKPRAPAPPEQPAAGFGSTDYSHAGVIETTLGDGADRVELFEPALPSPASAPVVVFLHGYGFSDSRNYGSWIRHLVRRGNIVIYPAYQDGYITLADDLTPTAANAIRRALELPGSGRHVPADLDTIVFVGHSAGAVIAANLAGGADEYGLPRPKAIMLANASDTSFGFGTLYNSIFDELLYARIPAETRLFAVIGSDDHIAPDSTSVRLLESANLVPIERKHLVRLYSDAYGCPRLIASHLAPGGVIEPSDEGTWTWSPRGRESRATALEFFGYWKWLDALIAAARSGDAAAGGEAAAVLDETFMGLWSDGVPVLPAESLWP